MKKTDKKIILGIDIGGSGIKGALVNTNTGVLVSERHRIPTPQPAKPKDVAKVLDQLIDYFDWKGKTVGCGFPAIVRKGVVFSASNIHSDWIGTNAKKLFSKKSKCKVSILNDADAAGLAEVKFGAGSHNRGTILLITVGTGLGSALVHNNKIIQNTEFGHLYFKGMIAERYASDATRKKENLTWQEWGKRFNEYLLHLERLLNPDLFIIGGGASKRFDKFSNELTLQTKVVPANLLNNAGIIGAALFAK